MYKSLIEMDILAFLLVGVLTVLLVVGMKETAKFNIAVDGCSFTLGCFRVSHREYECR